MTQQRHGLSIGIERTDSALFVSLKAQGKLNHLDYETITPMLDSALSQVTTPRVKVFIDASQLNGWEPRAAWDDLKLGLKHNNEFDKIALYGNKTWQEMAVKVGAWFVHGEMQFFTDESAALNWLHA